MNYVPEDFFNISELNDDYLFEDRPYTDDDYGNDDYGNDDLDKPDSDTSALEFRNGKDMQGIIWDRLSLTRDNWREKRLKEYKNFRNLDGSLAELKDCCAVERKNTFFDFNFNTREVKSTIMHFQLRNLVWATSKHDVYFVNHYSVVHWSATLRRGREVLNAADQLAPPSSSPLSRRGLASQPVSRVQISTMAMKDELLAVGGFQGELVCKRVDRPGIIFCSKVASNENAMTNSVDFYSGSSGSTRLMSANNDCQVRIFDVADISPLTNLSFPWPVNSTSVSPDGKLVAVLGDTADGLLVDLQSEKVVHQLKGHLDFSFASAWHPDGRIVATGSQDTTCRLWDVRNPSQAVAVLPGRMGAIRGLKFTADGRFLVAAEPTDFVHVFDSQAGYGSAQEIDLFGEIAGVSFSPDGEVLFVGVADRAYGSLLEFRRRRPLRYLDSLF